MRTGYYFAGKDTEHGDTDLSASARETWTRYFVTKEEEPDCRWSDYAGVCYWQDDIKGFNCRLVVDNLFGGPLVVKDLEFFDR